MSENLKVYTVEDLTEMLGTSKNAVYCLLKKNQDKLAIYISY